MASVAIVVDRTFGDALIDLAGRMPVWICDTPTNRPWIDACWKQDEMEVTSFVVREGDTAEVIALSRITDVNLHHEWAVLEFFGIGPTDALRSALAGYGVDRFGATPDGFVASREV